VFFQDEGKAPTSSPEMGERLEKAPTSSPKMGERLRIAL